MFLLAAIFACAVASDAATTSDTKPIACGPCDEWNAERAPFRVFGNTSYVGPAGVSVVVIQTKAGLVLIDGGLPQSAPLVVRNLERLGHRIEDVKWILMSHAHFDHVGGIAALVRLSNARVAASPSAAAVLRRGSVGPDDPQSGGGALDFPPVRDVVEMGDGAKLRLGGTTLTMHHTPGHTPGGTTWTWRTCEGRRCANVVYADSLNPISTDRFRFSADAARVAAFRRSIAKIRRLPCDVLIAAHPAFSGLFEKQAARETRAPGAPDAMLDPASCRVYAEQGAAKLDARLAEERRAAEARDHATDASTAPRPHAR